MQLSTRTQHLSSSLVREILAVAQQPDMISFAGGLPAAACMPELDLSRIPARFNQYGESQGEPAFRATIAAHLQTLGLPVSAEQILVTAGSQQGIDLISKLCIDPGTAVMVERPTYLAATQCFRFFGARLIELQPGESGPDLAALRTQLARERPAFVYLIPTFQNPTGQCYSLATRQAIASLLDEFEVGLVEDDPYRELVYEDCERTPICSFLQRAKWVYLGSFSKVAIPGLRLGYLAAHPALYDALLKIKQASDLHSNRWGQYLLNEFVQSPAYPAHLNALRQHYRQQREIMADCLNQDFAALAQWERPVGGLFFWVRLTQQHDMMALLQKALANKVAFMPGQPFFADTSQVYPAMRLNFSHSNAAQIKLGLQRLHALLTESSRPARD
ncbi:PLP-dependent aminotransferase family protein [Parvibium lacunae]|uniref:PLP-dependent aminotransferase family protein n=1 Tax=Parvibium lacunae TaxID=1888893 RepID=A0A368L6F1_9BURK|nr:PLP-dependent aminotransferase family protein [Parvibium lacunae]RCS59207.1 PLP-dependent aminotransferase family protein [Parvibium lacunae]